MDIAAGNSTLNNAIHILEDTVSKLPPWALTVLAVTAIAIGAILCFAGTKYSKFAGTQNFDFCDCLFF